MKAIGLNHAYLNRQTSYLFTLVAVLGSILVLLFCLPGTAKAASAYTISDNATGGDCTLIGTWDSSSKTCTLTSDLTVSGIDGIEILSDGITLTGNGHALQGSGSFQTGINLQNRTGVTVQNIAVSNFNYGVSLDNSNSLIITDNLITSNSFGIRLTDSDLNDLTDNVIASNSYGVYLSVSHSNDLTHNLITSNNWGTRLYNSNSNDLFSNSLFENEYAMEVVGSSNNIFESSLFSFNSYSGLTIAHRPKLCPFGGSCSPPILSENNLVRDVSFISSALIFPTQGGYYGNIVNTAINNYWNDFDEPSEGCEDLNGDGFCDSPYIFVNGQDNQPKISQPSCDGPQLRLSKTNTYWASYVDYESRLLSIDFDVVSFFDVSAVDIVGSSSTNGVTPTSTFPFSTSAIPAGGSASFKLQYNVPPGVASFMTTTYATAQDLCGNTYEYPGPYPGA